jgi:hypothetical protein
MAASSSSIVAAIAPHGQWSRLRTKLRNTVTCCRFRWVQRTIDTSVAESLHGRSPLIAPVVEWRDYPEEFGSDVGREPKRSAAWR